MTKKITCDAVTSNENRLASLPLSAIAPFISSDEAITSHSKDPSQWVATAGCLDTGWFPLQLDRIKSA